MGSQEAAVGWVHSTAAGVAPALRAGSSTFVLLVLRLGTNVLSFYFLIALRGAPHFRPCRVLW